jgi:copper resistance protein B
MSTQRTLARRHTQQVRAVALGALLALAPERLPAQPAAEASEPVGMPAHGALEDPFNRAILLDELEGLDANGTTDLRWDLSLWAGRSLEHFTMRSEGERGDGSTERAELQLLWTRAVARWWDVVAGARADFAPGSGKSWAAFGVQGLAPYRFEVEATAFVADGGDIAARVEAEYELLITSRLILQPQIELNWYGQSDLERGYGAGLSNGEAALRLRYEIRREFAPYVGIVRERLWGGTADAARAAGLDADDTSWVAGVRLRF